MILLTGKSARGKAATLLTAALLCSASTAQAGEWKIVELEAVGHWKVVKAHEGEPNADGSTNAINKTTPWFAWVYPEGTQAASLPTWSVSTPDVAAVSASVENKGTVRAILEWEPWGDTPEQKALDKPPPVVWLKISGVAAGEAVSDKESSRGSAAQENVTVSADGATGEPVFSPNGTKKQAVSQIRLVPVETGGQARVEGPPCALDAFAGIDDGRTYAYYYGNQMPLLGWAWAGVGYGASIDNRKVWIESPIHLSYHRGAALPEPINGQTHEVIPNMRKPDGSVLADSVINWDEAHGWVGGNTFIAEHPNFTSPTYQWNVTGSGEPVTIWDQEEMNSKRKQTTFQLRFSTDPNLIVANKGSTIKVDVTDGADGAKGTNTFTVRWHLPFENWARYKPDQEIWDYPSLNIDSPGYAMYGGGVMCHWNYEGCYWGDVAEALTSVAGSMVAPPWSGLFAAAGVSVDTIGPKPDSNTANFDACWGKDGSGYHPSRDDADKARYEMLPILRIGYTNRFLDGEVYASSGYMNQKKKVVQFFDGRREFVGEFHKVEVDPVAP